MDLKKALEILTALADGIDPATGEVFPADSRYQNPDVVRALHIATAALQTRIASAERNGSLPDNAGKAWSSAEEQLLIQGFDSGKTEAELAKVHQRTRGSIRSRLVRLGKIEPE
jgi:hypothetical protein